MLKDVTILEIRELLKIIVIFFFIHIVAFVYIVVCLSNIFVDDAKSFVWILGIIIALGSASITVVVLVLSCEISWMIMRLFNLQIEFQKFVKASKMVFGSFVIYEILRFILAITILSNGINTIVAHLDASPFSTINLINLMSHTNLYKMPNYP